MLYEEGWNKDICMFFLFKNFFLEQHLAVSNCLFLPICLTLLLFFFSFLWDKHFFGELLEGRLYYKGVWLAYSTIEWKCSRIRNGKIRRMKFLGGEIRIMKDDILVFWGGIRGIFPSVGSWFNFKIRNSFLINLLISFRYPHPYILFLNEALILMGW